MALPKWLARVNRRFVNPGAIKRGRWPVLIHTGRTSGTVYRTPLEVRRIDDLYVFTINYGSGSDWPRNVMAMGSAVLEIGGRSIPLAEPRLVAAAAAYKLLPPHTKTPPTFVGVDKCLLMTQVAAESQQPR